MIDDLDDSAVMPDAVVFVDFLNTQQYTVPDAGGFARPVANKTTFGFWHSRNSSVGLRSGTAARIIAWWSQISAWRSDVWSPWESRSTRHCGNG
jgi:hypothetical protein